MPVVLYSLYRLLLLAVAVVLLDLAGFESWLLLVLAVVVALLASQVLLRGPRDAAAVYLAQRAERRRAQRTVLEEDADAEDAESDAARRPDGDAPAS